MISYVDLTMESWRIFSNKTPGINLTNTQYSQELSPHKTNNIHIRLELKTCFFSPHYRSCTRIHSLGLTNTSVIQIQIRYGGFHINGLLITNHRRAGIVLRWASKKWLLKSRYSCSSRSSLRVALAILMFLDYANSTYT